MKHDTLQVITAGPWVKTFAYLPVKTIRKEWAWLCLIRKRKVHVMESDDYFDYQYARTVDLMVENLKGNL